IGENASRENAMGGGSSQVKAKYEITPLQGIKNLLGDQAKITYAQGYKIAKNQQADPQLIQQAVAAASASDAAVIFCGWTHGYDYSKWDDNAYDAEGVDKPNMNMPFGQDELIKAVLKANPKTIVVLMGGGPIDVSEWINNAGAVLEGWYPGMEGGNALAKIIFGEVNPSGKLPMTFPKKLEDSPAHKLGEFPGKNGVVHYNEGVFVGYRYFDTYHVQPQFAFGHGLSYTKFDYSNLNVLAGKNQATVKIQIKNSGKREGAEIVQIYVKQDKSTVERPEKELKAFQKVFLKPGESKIIELKLNADAFQYYNENQKKWVLEPGKFTIMAGSASDHILLNQTINL
ncbi:MAG: glycosyl hydrolase, partial [Sphingobacteriaceae bacterium]